MMYNIDYMRYMNDQIKKAKQKLIVEIIEDLNDIENWHVTELINKWKEKLKCLP